MCWRIRIRPWALFARNLDWNEPHRYGPQAGTVSHSKKSILGVLSEKRRPKPTGSPRNCCQSKSVNWCGCSPVPICSSLGTRIGSKVNVKHRKFPWLLPAPVEHAGDGQGEE